MLTVFAAVLMGAGCEGGGDKPMETTAVTEKDPDLMETPDFSGLSLEQIQMKYPKLNILPEYEYSDDLHFLAGYMLFGGDRRNDLGQYDRNDHLYLGVRYSF